MASLLDRASLIKDKIREEEDLNSIAPDQREKIFHEIDQLVDSKRMRFHDDDFRFSPKKNDHLFPLWVNGAALLLLGISSILFYLYFQIAESEITYGKSSGISTEGLLIENLKKESKAQMVALKSEISKIEGKLEQTQKEKELIHMMNQSRLENLELSLRDQYEREWENERRNLISQGITAQTLEEKKNEYDLKNETELENQIRDLVVKLEADKKEQERLLNSQIERYKNELVLLKSDDVDRFVYSEKEIAILKEENLKLSEKLTPLEKSFLSLETQLELSQKNLSALNNDLLQLRQKGVEREEDLLLINRNLQNRMDTILGELDENQKEVDSISFERFIVETDRGREYLSQKKNEKSLDAYRSAFLSLQMEESLVDSLFSQLQSLFLNEKEEGGYRIISIGDLEHYEKAYSLSKEEESIHKGIEKLRKRMVRQIDDEDYYKQTLALLSQEMKIREVLASETLQEEFPETYDSFNLYLNDYGENMIRQGERESLVKWIALIDNLMGRKEENIRDKSSLELSNILLDRLKEL